MSEETLKTLGEAAKARFAGGVSDYVLAFDELTLLVERERIVEVMTGLRDEPEFRFHQLVDLCGVDYPDRALRFDVVYHLLSLSKNLRVRVKVQTDEGTPVSTITSVYPNADWYEREAFDLLGILFANHPDLRRLLTDYGFTGHPLRRDFPMTGYVEPWWDEEQKRVVYQPVRMVQEFRKFDFLSPWEGAKYVLPGDEKAGG
jgi:NADH-quinone oxidoreductase subunit C